METNGDSDIKALVAGCIKGDRKSQEEFYKRFYGKMMAVCYRYSNDADDAADLLHDGFIKVFKNLPKYNFEGSLEGWVRRIMVNTSIDFYRKQKHSFTISEQETGDVQFQIEDDSPDVYSEMSQQDMMDAVQKLSPAYRAVFNMYVIEGYSHKDIAKELGISEGTSKSNLAKAKMNLQKVIRNEYWFEE